MDNQQFSAALKRNKLQVVNYLNNQASGMVIRQTLRFIDSNFRSQSWQGTYRKPWRKNLRGGTTLVKTGRLRRSFQYTGAGAGAVRFYSDTPYGQVHNRGFKGVISIKSHTRSYFSKSNQDIAGKFTKTGKQSTRSVYTKSGESTVKAHTRKVNIIQRQFAPYEGNESETMNKSIRKELEAEINKILTK
ncbi:MAG: hypothetical protein H7289_07785 [Mucilaginibacter sp.]|nr:hypothetical protein [Mucilaginibacter sp.]